jgi:pimeloyl-ACP methyl ester carboxylesterase
MGAAGSAQWLVDLGIPDDHSWIWAWYAHYGNYDNRAAWAAVRVPVLILFGGKDTVVPVDSSISQTVAILKRHGNSAVTVRVFADADHTLHVPPRTAGSWPHLPVGFPEVISAFVLSI